MSVLTNGLIRCDALSLGLDIADDGRPVDRLSYLGPWLRSRDWEATAVPELREHASRLAARLSAEVREDGSGSGPAEFTSIPHD